MYTSELSFFAAFKCYTTTILLLHDQVKLFAQDIETYYKHIQVVYIPYRHVNLSDGTCANMHLHARTLCLPVN